MTIWADLPSYTPSWSRGSPFADVSPWGLGSGEKNKIANAAGWKNSWGDTWTNPQRPGQYLSAGNLSSMLGKQQEAMRLSNPGSYNAGVDYMSLLSPFLESAQGAGGGFRTGLNSLMDNPNKVSDTNAYKFRLSQGQQALERSAAAKGNLNSGNTMAALMEYGQGMASTEYDKEFDRMLSGVNSENQTTQTRNSLANLVLEAGKAKSGDYWKAQDTASKNALATGYLNSSIW